LKSNLIAWLILEMIRNIQHRMSGNDNKGQDQGQGQGQDFNKHNKTQNKRIRKPMFTFDILFGTGSIEKFITMYGPLVQNIMKQDKLIDHKIENDKYEEMLRLIKIVVENELWTKIKHLPDTMFNGKYKLGTVVSISYWPASQRYIEHYEQQAFAGRVIFVDNDNDNMLLLVCNGDDQLDNGTWIIKSLERAGCHYFGISRGYEYIID
jgi:hypothetical protein